jgi:hypothetical protein
MSILTAISINYKIITRFYSEQRYRNLVIFSLLIFIFSGIFFIKKNNFEKFDGACTVNVGLFNGLPNIKSNILGDFVFNNFQSIQKKIITPENLSPNEISALKSAKIIPSSNGLALDLRFSNLSFDSTNKLTTYFCERSLDLANNIYNENIILTNKKINSNIELIKKFTEMSSHTNRTAGNEGTKVYTNSIKNYITLELESLKLSKEVVDLTMILKSPNTIKPFISYTIDKSNNFFIFRNYPYITLLLASFLLFLFFPFLFQYILNFSKGQNKI